MHFGPSDNSVALAVFITDGAACRDNSDVNNAASAQYQPIFLSVLVHFFEQHFAKDVLLQQDGETEDRSLVRQPIQSLTSELTHGFDLVQSFFHRRVTEVIERLHEVNPQHHTQRVRRSTSLAFGIMAGYLFSSCFQGINLSAHSRKIRRASYPSWSDARIRRKRLDPWPHLILCG